MLGCGCEAIRVMVSSRSAYTRARSDGLLQQRATESRKRGYWKSCRTNGYAQGSAARAQHVIGKYTLRTCARRLHELHFMSSMSRHQEAIAQALPLQRDRPHVIASVGCSPSYLPANREQTIRLLTESADQGLSELCSTYQSQCKQWSALRDAMQDPA